MKTSVTITGRFSQETSTEMINHSTTVGGFENIAFFNNKKDAEEAIEKACFFDGQQYCEISMLAGDKPNFEIKKVYQKEINTSDLLQQIYS